MPNYRRYYEEGATVFITLVTYDRVPFLVNPAARQILRTAWTFVAKRHPFTTDAICLLPDHIHLLMSLPQNDADYSVRIREIKRIFTKRYLLAVGEPAQRNQSRKNKKEAAIWQRRFWEHTIRNEKDYVNHFNYIHYNPVKHRLVNAVSSWKWSSFHRYVKEGVYDADWGKGFEDQVGCLVE